MLCPFCHKNGFNKFELKDHLKEGWCNEYNYLNDKETTSCWNCSFRYIITYKYCPCCGLINANVDLASALNQQDEMKKLEKPLDKIKIL